MKKYLYFFIVGIIIFGIYYSFKKQNDWSEINALIYDTCVNDEKSKKNCNVDFHKLSVPWDDIYFFGGGSQGYADKLIGEKNKIKLSPYCEYLLLKKNNKFKKVYTQCFDHSYSYLKNVDNTIALHIWIKKCESPSLSKTFGKSMPLKRFDNYYENNKTIVYELSCE